MNTIPRTPDRSGYFVPVEGADGRGTYTIGDIVPLSITSLLGGRRLGDFFEIDDPANKWLEDATVISADPGPTGTCFELAYLVATSPD